MIAVVSVSEPKYVSYFSVNCRTIFEYAADRFPVLEELRKPQIGENYREAMRRGRGRWRDRSLARSA